MLNYIWAGLIIVSLVFALTADTRDLLRDTYRNDQAFPLTVVVPEETPPEARRVPVTVLVDPETFRAFYRTEAAPDTTYAATLIRTQEGLQLRFAAEAAFPEPWVTIRDVTNPRDRRLQGELLSDELLRQARNEPGAYPAEVLFEPVRFVKLNAIAQAALDFAETAASIALGLIGVLALFLGLLKIGEEAGVIQALVRFVRPVLRPLFPTVPADHPALGMIALNMTANIFGLGNAATPFGIKAMEELQKLNPSDDTATDPMVMLLAINTASVQLVPPVLLLALMGLQINQLIFAIIATTAISLAVAIVAAKLLGRLPAYRRSDPNRLAPAPAPADAASDTDRA